MEYFVSDMHFNHAAALNFDPRPFLTVNEMNTVMLRNWNARVTERDTVYILGDLMWSIERDDALDLLEKLNGHLVLIKGNHENRWLHGDEVKARFERIVDYLDIRVKRPDGTKMFVAMSHYPIHYYNHAHREGLMLYGHVHGGKEYVEVMRQQRDLVARGVPCWMCNTFAGLFGWAPATLPEVIARGKADMDGLDATLKRIDAEPRARVHTDALANV